MALSVVPGLRLLGVLLALLAVAGYFALLLQQQAGAFADSLQAAAAKCARSRDMQRMQHREYIGESLASNGCSDKEHEQQASEFLEYRGNAQSRLGCGMLDDLDPFLKKLWNPKEQLVTMVNVGANKGYTLLQWMQLWKLVEGKTSADWNEILIQKYKPAKGEEWKICGTCGNCNPPIEIEEPAVEYGPDRGVHMYGLEPSIAHFKLLVGMKEWTGYEKMALLLAAASNHSGMSMFPITSVLGETSTSAAADVRVLTVDEFVEEYRIDHINYLKIYTEGQNPLVLSGAMKTFQSHRVELVEFGYHKLGAWKSTNLEDVVHKFDSFGYDCFLALWKDDPTRDKVICLTGCWHSAYEFHDWSNVICTSRRNMALTRFLRKACMWR